MERREVYIVSAARTPIGSFLGRLAPVSAVQLGACAIRGALERAGLPGERVDAAFVGQVLTAGVGQAPARQAAKRAAIPDRVPATTIGKVCGSSLQTLIFGAQAIQLGDAEVVVAAGMESMSNAPYLLPGGRAGLRLGNAQLIDSVVHDGLWDAYDDVHMGAAADLCARERSISRAEQDGYAERSYRRAQAAQASGALAQEIVKVEVRQRKRIEWVDEDEEPGRARFEKMPTLKPSFSEQGTVTAANASKLNDGGSAVVLASAEAVREHGLTPMARLVGYAGHAQAPLAFTTAPIGAMRAVLGRTQLSVQDIDLWEINEAFAVVALACAGEVGVPDDQLNVRGGAVALGHPIGATGTRLVTTLVYAMKEREARRGLATACIGGGEALAVVLEGA